MLRQVLQAAERDARQLAEHAVRVDEIRRALLRLPPDFAAAPASRSTGPNQSTLALQDEIGAIGLQGPVRSAVFRMSQDRQP